MTTKPQAVVLLSGGLDSTTVLAMAMEQGFECCCLSFDYGQRQAVELERARALAASFGVRRHLVLRVDLSAIGGSALTTAMAVPKDRDPAAMEEGIPATYVPARNLVFLAHAVAWAEVLGSGDVFLGVNAVDFSGYPDCRPDFLRAFEQTANLGTRAGSEGGRLRIHAPLIAMSKKEIIQAGLALGVDYGMTHSCYDPDPVDGLACGRCDACLLRQRGFAEAGQADPLPYADRA